MNSLILRRLLHFNPGKDTTEEETTTKGTIKGGREKSRKDTNRYLKHEEEAEFFTGVTRVNTFSSELRVILLLIASKSLIIS